MNGFIKLHRQLIEWEWYEDVNCRLTFIHCLLVANFKPKKWRGYDIKRGQFISSLGKLSEAIGISKQQLRTVLEKFEKTGEMLSEGQGNNTLFTVLNYDDYQDIKQENKNEATHLQHTSNTPPTHEQHASNTGVTTTKEGKKEKKEEKERSKDIVNVIDVCTFFQSETGKSLKIPNSDSKIKRSDKYKKINARLQEGATVEDCKAVIRLKNNEWKSNNDMKKYIQISTLFARANFEKYMDEILSSSGSTAPKTFSYELPEFKSKNQREAYFRARLQTYRPKLDNRTYNTVYHKRAYGPERDVEGVVHDLEKEKPELLKIKFISDSWLDIQ
jgi:uncharacterized phage protein (TIGR02220 family)